MAREHANLHETKSRSGAGLVILGMVALAADLTFLAAPLAQLVERSRGGLLGTLPSIGLSLLQAAQALAFGQVDYFSLISRILVSFLAMMAVIVGMALMRSGASETGMASTLYSSSGREQELD